jgi:hypothetical protein
MAHHGEHKKMKSHPHHRGGGLPEFHEGHKEHAVADVMYADTKYGSEFGQGESYKKSVDAANAYIRKHKAHH